MLWPDGGIVVHGTQVCYQHGILSPVSIPASASVNVNLPKSIAAAFTPSAPLCPRFSALLECISVRFEGYLMGPVNGTVSLRTRADDLFRLTVDGTVIMDTISSGGEESTSVLESTIEMVKVRPYIACFGFVVKRIL